MKSECQSDQIQDQSVKNFQHRTNNHHLRASHALLDTYSSYSAQSTFYFSRFVYLYNIFYVHIFQHTPLVCLSELNHIQLLLLAVLASYHVSLLV